MDALLWQEKALSLLDQRKYPAEEHWYDCKDYRSVVNVLNTPAVSGEAILSIAGAYAYCLAALEFEGADDFYAQLTKAKKEITATHPDSKALAEAFKRLEQAYEAYRDSDQLITALLATAVTIHRQDVIACRSMTRQGREIIPTQGNIVVSSAGSLYHTGGVGGVLGVLQGAASKHGLTRVFVCENRPSLAGLSLARALAKKQIPVSLIPDHAAATLMPRQSCDMVLLEGVRVAANGDLLVSPGGYELAIAAYFHSIQVYATVYTASFDLETPNGEAFPKEDGDPAALSQLGGAALLPDGVDAWAPKYDMLPHYLLTGLITEKGLAFPSFEETLPALLAKTPDKPVLFL